MLVYVKVAYYLLLTAISGAWIYWGYFNPFHAVVGIDHWLARIIGPVVIISFVFLLGEHVSELQEHSKEQRESHRVDEVLKQIGENDV